MTQHDMTEYRLIEGAEYVEGSGLVTTYGICCGDDRQVADGSSAEYQAVPHISTRSDFVEELIEKLVSNNAAPVHLKDLIDDYLP